MNAYEAKQEARKERFEQRAKKAEQESTRRWKASSDIVGMIPMGQPILVGHHSEKSHRAALKRSDNHMRASIAEQEKAEYYEHKAAGVGKAGISSDDPEAVVKLTEKLERLEKSHEIMKRLNASYRAVKGDIDLMTTEKSETRAKLKAAKNSYYLGPDRFQPFEPWQLSNSNANIKRYKKRIAELRATANRTEAEDIQGDGYIIKQCKEDNRIRFIFDEKPPPEICQIMRRNGWKFSRYNMAWQRHLNNNGRYSAKSVIRQLAELAKEEG
jgi:hypothetical protein